MLILCIQTLIYFWFLSFNYRQINLQKANLNSLKLFQSLLLEIQRIFSQSHGSKLLNLQFSSLNKTEIWFLNLIKKNYFEGLSIKKEIDLAITEIVKIQTMIVEQDRFKNVIFYRTLFILGLALSGRWMLYLVNYRRIDIFLSLLCPSLAIVISNYLFKWNTVEPLDKNWFWQNQNLTLEAKQWLELLFSKLKSKKDISLWTEKWLKIRYIELKSGIDESFASQLLIQEWAQTNFENGKNSLHQLTEWLPAYELISLGLALLLFFIDYLVVF